MVRSTSVEAYYEVLNCGWIGKKQKEIYKCLSVNGSLTSGEVFEILNANKPLKCLTQSRARFTELRDCNAIKEVNKRRCRTTGRMAICWAITNGIVTKPRARETKDQIINRLEKEIKLLKDEIFRIKFV